MSLENIRKIQNHEKIVEREIDAIFITKKENIIFLLGFRIESEVFIMVPRKDLENHDGKVWVFLNALEYDQAQKIITNDPELSKIIEIKQIPGGKTNFIQKTINKLKLKRVGFEDDYISVKRYHDWQEKFSIDSFIGAGEIITHARLQKTQDEINRMRRAAQLGDIGFQAIINCIKEGMTEKQLAAEAEFAMRKAGSDGTSFDTIIASGENSAYPHAITSEKKIEDGDIIIVDIGAKFNGYCSDMTRTFIFGTVHPNKAELVNLVNNAEQFALDNITLDMNCRDLDKLTRDYFIEKKKEWGSRFIHSLGHGVGIDIHEDPYISPISNFVLKEAMTVTIEPGLYIPGLGGARTEDQIVITNYGYIALTESPKYYY